MSKLYNLSSDSGPKRETRPPPKSKTFSEEREQKISYHMVGNEITAYVTKNQVAAHVPMN